MSGRSTSYFTLILFTSLDCSQAGRKLKGEAKALIAGSRVKSPPVSSSGGDREWAAAKGPEIHLSNGRPASSFLHDPHESL